MCKNTKKMKYFFFCNKNQLMNQNCAKSKTTETKCQVSQHKPLPFSLSALGY